jgi:hypothetical protein
MGVVWTESAGKHDVPREDVLWAPEHAAGSEELDGRPGWITRVWVGHPHAQTDRYIDVIAAANGSDVVIKREGRTRSALIRDAVAEYARSHRAV